MCNNKNDKKIKSSAGSVSAPHKTKKEFATVELNSRMQTVKPDTPPKK